MNGLYRWLRFSPHYLWYARVFRRPFARAAAADKWFFQNLFTDRGVRVVFDIGANYGDKTEVFRSLADRVICAEADPNTAELLDYRFRHRSSVAVESTAMGAYEGRIELRRKKFCAYNTVSEKWATAMDAQALPTTDTVPVPMTTLDRLIAKHGRPDYVKIDVEGYELPVIQGLTTAVPVVSFEANLPIFRDETEQIVAQFLKWDPDTVFNARHETCRDWMLPTPTDAQGLRRFMDSSGEFSCDIFAFSSRRP